MPADWEPRVSRLEMGFCAAFVLIFAAIITSYIMLAGKIDSSRDALTAVQVEQGKSGERLAGVAAQQQDMDEKIDLLLERKEATK